MNVCICTICVNVFCACVRVWCNIVNPAPDSDSGSLLWQNYGFLMRSQICQKNSDAHRPQMTALTEDGRPGGTFLIFFGGVSKRGAGKTKKPSHSHECLWVSAAFFFFFFFLYIISGALQSTLRSLANSHRAFLPKAFYEWLGKIRRMAMWLLHQRETGHQDWTWTSHHLAETAEERGGDELQRATQNQHDIIKEACMRSMNTWAPLDDDDDNNTCAEKL